MANKNDKFDVANGHAVIVISYACIIIKPLFPDHINWPMMCVSFEIESNQGGMDQFCLLPLDNNKQDSDVIYMNKRRKNVEAIIPEK